MAAVAIVAIAGCGSSGSSPSSSGSAAAKKTVVFGAVLPMSGTFADVGTSAKTGINAAIRVINDAGGILGSKVESKIIDDGGDPQRAIAAMRTLLGTPNLIGVLPEIFSNIVPTLAPLAQAKGIPEVGVATVPELADGSKYPWLYEANRSTTKAVYAQLRYLKSKGAKTIGILNPDFTTGNAVAQAAAAEAPALGLKVVAHEEFPITATDATAQVQKIKAAKPDALLIWATGQPLGVIANAIQTTGWKVPVVGGGEALSANLGDTIPSSVRSQFHFLTNLPLVRVNGQVDPKMQKFIDAVKADGDSTGGLQTAILLNEALSILRYGYEKAGSFDAAKAVAAINGMKDDTNVADYWILEPKSPRFDAKVHGLDNVDFSKDFWGVVGATNPIDGTFPGVAFNY
jgi:ABC-type branched-subunit amino acid transport system substrate-binding protein